VDFSVDELQVTVRGIRSGYNAAQLARTLVAPDDPVALHQAFTAAHARAATDQSQ
jgi:hypothetical protein